MNRFQEMVREFHRAMKVETFPGLDMPPRKVLALRADLINEEASEFRQAAKEGDFFKMLDGLCDILYVAFGTADVLDVDLEPFFEEVHRSNMTKVGGPVRADGKILKPESYSPPDLRAVFARWRHAQDEAREMRGKTLVGEPGVDATFEDDPFPILQTSATTRHTLSAHERLALELGALVTKKQASYGRGYKAVGDALASMFPNGVPPEAIGHLPYMTRILEKFCRIAAEPDAFGENPWKDAAGTALCAAHDTRGQNGCGRASPDDACARHPEKPCECYAPRKE